MLLPEKCFASQPTLMKSRTLKKTLSFRAKFFTKIFHSQTFFHVIFQVYSTNIAANVAFVVDDLCSQTCSPFCAREMRKSDMKGSGKRKTISMDRRRNRSSMNENEENLYAETFAVHVYVERGRYTQHSSNLRASLE